VGLDLRCSHPHVSLSFLIHLLLLLSLLWSICVRVSCGHVFEWLFADVGTLIDDVVAIGLCVVKEDSMGRI